MTREEAKKWIPIIQAFADGKTIEFFKQGEWYEVKEPDFMWSAYKYRIKLEPKYRPFKTKEECWTEMHKHPDFGWLKSKQTGDFAAIGAINKDKTGDVRITWSTNEGYNYTASQMFDNYEFTDGTPFGVKEE